MASESVRWGLNKLGRRRFWGERKNLLLFYTKYRGEGGGGAEHKPKNQKGGGVVGRIL